MKIKITQSINGLLTVREIRTAVTILPFDIGLGAVNLSLIDAVGDLIVGSEAGVADKLSVGANGQMLTADDTEPLGMKWGPPTAIATFSLTNQDGTQHEIGEVVYPDLSNNNSCKRCTTSGDPKVIAVSAEVVGASEAGLYIQNGQTTVLVQGNVSRGMWLVPSATSGRAKASGYIKPTSGAIGIALTEYTGGGAGSVTALVAIQLGTTAPLQQLPTITKYTGSGSPATFSHVTDAGTDLCLVLVVGSSSAMTYTSCTHDGTGMTGVAGASGYAQSYWIRNPTIGTKNIVLTYSGGAVYFVVLNFSGSQVSPLRTETTVAVLPGTTITRSPTSAVGDICVDVVRMGVAGWSITGGQTAITVSDPTTTYVSYKAGEAGSTTMSWAGPSTNGAQLAFAIAGS